MTLIWDNGLIINYITQFRGGVMPEHKAKGMQTLHGGSNCLYLHLQTNFGKIRQMDVFGILDKEVDIQDFRRRYLSMNSVDFNPFLRY